MFKRKGYVGYMIKNTIDYAKIYLRNSQVMAKQTNVRLAKYAVKKRERLYTGFFTSL